MHAVHGVKVRAATTGDIVIEALPTIQLETYDEVL